MFFPDWCGLSAGPETDIGTIQRLALAAKSPEEKARLESLVERLQSPDEQVRKAAARETHAWRALQHPSLKEKGRTASESRMKPRTAPSSPAASSKLHASSAVASSPAAAAAAAGDGESSGKPSALRRLSFWQRRRGSVTVTGPKSDAKAVAALPSEWDESWEVPCDVLGSADWDNPFVSTDQHRLLAVKTKKFSVALGGPATGALPDGLVLEDWESYRFLYEEVFVGRPHVLYLGRGPKGPVVVAIESMAPTEKRGDRLRFRVLALDKNGYHKSVIGGSKDTRERLRLVKKALPQVLEGVALRKPEKQQQLGTQMMIFEKKRVVHHAKFGLLYRKAGQTEENEVYSNEHGSPQFVAFLAAVADIVPLRGHVGFRGGLDVKEDLTGVSSGFTRVAYDTRGAPAAVGGPEASLTMEVMLHVAPLLPYDPVNPQQLHRKRHVGNDVVVVVFCEGDEPFNPETLTSNYNHVFVLVRPVPDDPSGRKKVTHYEVCHASVRGVKPFRPFVPAEGTVAAADMRAWLLTKVLNAERAAMYAPEFSQKLSRTITTVVGSWVDEF